MSWFGTIVTGAKITIAAFSPGNATAADIAPPQMPTDTIETNEGYVNQDLSNVAPAPVVKDSLDIEATTELAPQGGEPDPVTLGEKECRELWDNDFAYGQIRDVVNYYQQAMKDSNGDFSRFETAEGMQELYDKIQGEEKDGMPGVEIGVTKYGAFLVVASQGVQSGAPEGFIVGRDASIASYPMNNFDMGQVQNCAADKKTPNENPQFVVSHANAKSGIHRVLNDEGRARSEEGGTVAGNDPIDWDNMEKPVPTSEKGSLQPDVFDVIGRDVITKEQAAEISSYINGEKPMPTKGLGGRMSSLAVTPIPNAMIRPDKFELPDGFVASVVGTNNKSGGNRGR